MRYLVCEIRASIVVFKVCCLAVLKLPSLRKCQHTDR